MEVEGEKNKKKKEDEDECEDLLDPQFLELFFE